MNNDWGKFISSNLLNKAKSIIEHDKYSDEYDEEIKYRKQIIIALCLKYNFKYQFVNDIVFIYSIIDEWYFDYSKDTISLFHKNKLYTNKQYHLQKKFKNIIHVIQYIKKHDNFYYKPNNKHKFDLIERHKDNKEIKK